MSREDFSMGLAQDRADADLEQRQTEDDAPDELDRLVAVVDAGRDAYQHAQQDARDKEVNP